MSAIAVGPLVYEEQVVISFVPADAQGWGIADLDSPTTSEIGDGVDITSYFAKTGGLNRNRTQNMADTSSLDKRDDTSFPLGLTGNPTLTMKRRNADGDEEAYELFRGGNVPGDFVIGKRGSNDTAGDEVEIIRAIAGVPIDNDPSGGDEQRFGLTLGIQDHKLDAEVTSG